MSRRYTNDEKLAALRRLDVNGGQIASTSKATGIPEKTLREWRRKFGVVSAIRALREEMLGKSLELVSHLTQANQETPIHQRTAALNHMISNILQLTEVLEEQLGEEQQQVPVFRIEYVDEQGHTHSSPPDAERDNE